MKITCIIIKYIEYDITTCYQIIHATLIYKQNTRKYGLGVVTFEDEGMKWGVKNMFFKKNTI